MSRVLLTGGTGFVGSYTIPALLARGHDVCLLVRDEGRAVATLARRGIERGAVDVVPGDVLDRASIAAALDGCDAAIHAAAAIGVTTGASVTAANVDGTRNVVGLALDAGCDPVVHVSTLAVFLPPSEPVLTADSPLGAPGNEYGRSKLEAERWVRTRQDAGAPVTIVYPGGVIGPDQPSLDASLEGLAAARRIAWPLAPGGVCFLDARDLGDALAAAVRPGLAPARLLIGGRFTTWPELGDLADEICGVRARRAPLPRPLLLATGRVLDVVRRVVHVRYPLTRDAAEIMTAMVPTDDRPALDALGVELRPLRDTLADTLRWLVDAGHLPAKHAPSLAGP